MKILHLYHDIMNLYGEYANVKAMERIFGNSGITYTTDRLSIGDDVDISAYDAWPLYNRQQRTKL